MLIFFYNIFFINKIFKKNNKLQNNLNFYNFFFYFNILYKNKSETNVFSHSYIYNDRFFFIFFLKNLGSTKCNDMILNKKYNRVAVYNNNNNKKKKFRNLNVYLIIFKCFSFLKSLGPLNNYFNFLFLRKNKIFNKSRYSRNRQFYRTGVYWCIYINIIAVIGIYFWFYKISINYNYIWLFIYIFFFSFFFSRVVNINSYKILFKILNWHYHILNCLINIPINLIALIKKKLINININIIL